MTSNAWLNLVTTVRRLAFAAAAASLTVSSAMAFDPSPSKNPSATTSRGVLNVMSYGAVGDGDADDAAAIAAAVKDANNLVLSGRSPVVYFPEGIYRISSPPPAFVGHVGIRGDGPYRSYLKIDPALSGDIFSWSESWMGASGRVSDYTLDIKKQRHGASVEGIMVVGDRRAPREQNVFVFYDRNDNVLFRDVAVNYINGRCLYFGATKATDKAYVRESQFFNVQCRNTGSANVPAVEISSAGDGDASNQLYFYDLKIVFPFGTGLKIGTDTPINSAIRNVFFSGLMVHGIAHPNPPIAKDLVVIGGKGGKGKVRDVTIQGFSGNRSYEGYYTLALDADDPFTMPFNIDVSGTIGSGANGVNIGAGRSVRLKIQGMAVGGTAIRVGPSPLIGKDITVDVNDEQNRLRYDLDKTAEGKVRFLGTGSVSSNDTRRVNPTR